ncbi:hypothetical protein B0H19DRAFT_1083937 [Mycena capillaripes]|nr:hypothetical protein B0H19DRAFT_1083937 [Mycena capillaripes]
MSQSGNAALAARTLESSLPSPSPSLSDLPDLPNSPPDTPKTLVANVREILEHTKQKKKNLTVGIRWKHLRDVTEGLQARSARQDQRVCPPHHLRVNCCCPTTLLLPPPSSSRPSRSPTPPTPKTTATRSWTVTILLDKESNILTLLPPEIKSRVKSAITAAGIERLKGVALRGVKVLPRGRVLVAVNSDRAASLLKQSAAHWVPRLAKNGSLVVLVPTSFNPSSPTAALDLYSRNRSAFRDPSVISEIRWLNPKVIRDPKKKASSLLLSMLDELGQVLSQQKMQALFTLLCKLQRECPMRVKERELQSQRLCGRIFFDPNFDPTSALHDDASAPFFINTSAATPSPPSSPSK